MSHHKKSAVTQMDALEEFLVEQYKEGQTVIVMVDEAQLLRLESMECIRSLLNYETNTEKLCQAVLAVESRVGAARNRMAVARFQPRSSDRSCGTTASGFPTDSPRAHAEHQRLGRSEWTPRTPKTDSRENWHVPRECVVV